MQGTTEHSGSPRVLLNLPLPNLPFLDMPFFFITSNQRWVGTSTHICMVSFKSSLKIMHNKDRLNSLQKLFDKGRSKSSAESVCSCLKLMKSKVSKSKLENTPRRSKFLENFHEVDPCLSFFQVCLGWPWRPPLAEDFWAKKQRNKSKNDEEQNSFPRFQSFFFGSTKGWKPHFVNTLVM